VTRRGRPRGPRRAGLVSEINVTPLVDVVLVLLIIFMVVAPYLHRGVEVGLPVAEHGERGEMREGSVVVTLTEDGTVYLDRSPVARGQLVRRLRERLAARPATDVLVRGDARARYGDVQRLLTWLRDTGAPGVSLATTTEEEL